MTKTTDTSAKKSLAYVSFFYGPKVEGYNVPCFPLDSKNVLRSLLLAIAPEGTTKDDILQALSEGPAALLKKDIVMKVRLQRWFKGTEANPNDPDGLVPSVGANGNIVDVAPYEVEGLLALVNALATSKVVKAASKVTLEAKAIRQAEREAKKEANGKKCPKCGHLNKQNAKFCEECGHKLPDVTPAPAPAPTSTKWKCECGTENEGKFCEECGSKRPDATPTKATTKAQEAPEAPKTNQTTKGTKKGSTKPQEPAKPPVKDEDGPQDLEELESALMAASALSTVPAGKDKQALLAKVLAALTKK